MQSIRDQFPECASLLDVANEAARQNQALWFGFMTFGAFLGVAVAGTTHRDLFLENPISLPILSLDLPLFYFYVVGPAIFVIFHLYMMVKMLLLERAHDNFRERMERDIRIRSDRDRMRKLINTTIFLQTVDRAGDGWTLLNTVLRLVVWITLVAAPIGLLLFIQVKLLPYQSHWATNAHRFLILFDLTFLAMIWRAKRPARWLTVSAALRILPSVPVALISLFIFTFPTDRLDNTGFARIFFPEPERLGPFIAPNEDSIWSDISYLVYSRRLGTIETTANHFLWPTTLKLANEDFVDDLTVDLEKVESTEIFRNRNLIGADLRDTDLREAVFDGANLSWTYFNRSRLNGAKFNRSNLQGAKFGSSNAREASFRWADLTASDLTFADFQGADFSSARLYAIEAGGTSFHGANFDGTRIHFSDIIFGRLIGVNLNSTSFLGTDFSRIHAMGTNFSRSDISCPTDWTTQKFLANLITQETFEDIGSVDLKNDNFMLWELQISKDGERIIDIDHLLKESKKFPEDISDRLSIQFERFKGNCMNPEFDGPAFEPLSDYLLELQNTSDEDFTKDLIEVACFEGDPPYAARGILNNGIIERTGSAADDLRTAYRFALKDETRGKCPGAVGLTDEDYRKLDEEVERALAAS